MPALGRSRHPPSAVVASSTPVHTGVDWKRTGLPLGAGAYRSGRASAVGLSEAFSQTIGIGRLSDSPVVNPPVRVRACRGSAASTAGRLFVATLAKNSGELVVAAAIRLACHLGHVTSIPDFS
jgi:hypothetical protein